MNAATETSEAFATPTTATQRTRPVYWSVRRELWEHRSLFIAPLVAAGVVLFAFLVNAVHMPEGMRILGTLPPERQRSIMTGVLTGTTMIVTVITIVAAWFYLLDALQAERRDRSVLFWKSLPVSDTTAVLSKLFTGTIGASLIAMAIIIATQLLLLLLGTAIALVSGASPVPIWTNSQLPQLTLALIYADIVIVLWYAPVAAWLLLISAWAKRSTFLWAVLPPLALIFFERIALGASYVADLLAYRLRNGLQTAFVPRERLGDIAFQTGGPSPRIQMPHDVLQTLDPVGFFTNPYLWIGLVVAAALVAATVWMRRYREPL